MPSNLPPYGFWTFNNHLNGLEGAESTVEYLNDGRMILVKDPNYPAVLEDEFILYSLKTSRIARKDFDRLFPTLDDVSKDRLSALIQANPWVRKLIEPEQVLLDIIQKREVQAGVHTRVPRPSI